MEYGLLGTKQERIKKHDSQVTYNSSLYALPSLPVCSSSILSNELPAFKNGSGLSNPSYLLSSSLLC